MTGVEFLARLAAIICPPRYPLVRFAGVLAPRSAWRSEVVPKPREGRDACVGTHTERSARTTRHFDQPKAKSGRTADQRSVSAALPFSGGIANAGTGQPTTHANDMAMSATVLRRVPAGDVIQLAPNIL